MQDVLKIGNKPATPDQLRIAKAHMTTVVKAQSVIQQHRTEIEAAAGAGAISIVATRRRAGLAGVPTAHW